MAQSTGTSKSQQQWAIGGGRSETPFREKESAVIKDGRLANQVPGDSESVALTSSDQQIGSWRRRHVVDSCDMKERISRGCLAQKERFHREGQVETTVCSKETQKRHEYRPHHCSTKRSATKAHRRPATGRVTK
jgi:hypothetical protein